MAVEGEDIAVAAAVIHSAVSLRRLAELRSHYAGCDAMSLLRGLHDDRELASRIAVVSAFGAESAVLLDMVASIDPAWPVLFLDTGKHFPPDVDHLIAHVKLTNVRSLQPAPGALQAQDFTGELWRQSPDACCRLRKTEPLSEALGMFAAWVTGRKRFHGAERARLEVFELERGTSRSKFSLARWSGQDVANYLRTRKLPMHPLVAAGFRSIGCAPCTLPIGHDKSPRCGRWRGRGKTECGNPSWDRIVAHGLERAGSRRNARSKPIGTVTRRRPRHPVASVPVQRSEQWPLVSSAPRQLQRSSIIGEGRLGAQLPSNVSLGRL